MSDRYLFSVLIFLANLNKNLAVRVTDNPADQIVDIINKNRTAQKSSALYSNPGLACIALQYIKAYEGDCGAVGEAKKPSDSQIAKTFAPNCGVEATTLSQFTGRFLGCQSKYAKPEKAFSEVLMKNKESLDILLNKNHTEVGAAVSGSDGGGPYFWCVLFSNGKRNSSFVLKGGTATITRPGCFSGANDQCNGASDWSGGSYLWSFGATALVAVGFAFGL